MTLNFFGCFNVSGIKTQPTNETVDYEMNVLINHTLTVMR